MSAVVISQCCSSHFRYAFQGEDEVCLVLKVPEDGEESVRRTLETTMLSMPGRRSGTWPKVYVVAESLSRQQMARLHASVDCYVSCERGNGWDLPAMDSLVLGVPVIATDFGASSTFLSDDDCYIVRTSSRMVTCQDREQHVKARSVCRALPGRISTRSN